MFINFVLKNICLSFFKCGICMMYLYRKRNIDYKINYLCFMGVLCVGLNY